MNGKARQFALRLAEKQIKARKAIHASGALSAFQAQARAVVWSAGTAYQVSSRLDLSMEASMPSLSPSLRLQHSV